MTTGNADIDALLSQSEIPSDIEKATDEFILSLPRAELAQALAMVRRNIHADVMAWLSAPEATP